MIDFSKIDDYKENNRLEVKSAQGGLPHSIWQTYSAFANTSGGMILLGVEEMPDKTLKILGIDNPEKQITDFWNIINNSNKVSVNFLNDDHVQIVETKGKHIIKIEIPRAERVLRPIYLDNNYNNVFRRNNDGDYRCGAVVTKAMFRDAAPETQDTVVLERCSIDTFNADTVRSYKNNFRNKHPGHVWENISNDEFLLKIGALSLGADNKIHPTAAGLLMFGNEYEIVREFPQYFLDYQEHYDSTVRWTNRYVSSNGEWSGNIFDFFYKAYNSIIQNPNIKRPFTIASDGISRTDDTDIHEAIREALVNCLIHADYYGDGGVVIKNYLSRIEFSNPGALRVSLDYALAGGYSSPRNGILIKMFSLLEIGERAGSGIPKVYFAWKNNGLTNPILKEDLVLERTTLTLEIKYSEIAPDTMITSETGYKPMKISDKTSDKTPKTTKTSDKTSDNAPKTTKTSDKTSDKTPKITKTSDKTSDNAPKTTKTSDKTSEKNNKTTKTSDKTSDKKNYIMEKAKTKGKIKTSDIIDDFSVTPRQINTILNQLVNEGMLIAEGKNKGRTYRLP